MQPEVFICHSSADKQIADRICSSLEENGIKCWIAPRDIHPGVEFPVGIINGIAECNKFLPILSNSSIASPHVKNEIATAVENNLTIIPFMTEDLRSSLPGEIDYYIKRYQWIYAFIPSIEENIQRLPQIIVELRNNPNEQLKISDRYNELPDIPPAKNINIHYYPDVAPVIDEFIDRVSYIENLKGSLNKTMIVIQGMAGIGKTYLAAKFKELIDSEGNFVTSWKEMRTTDTFDSMAMFFAGFLHENNDPELLLYLNRGSRERETIINLILKSLSNNNFVMFFDNYHTIKDEEIHQLFSRLKNGNHRSTVVLTTRNDPDLINTMDRIKKTISSELIEGFDKEGTIEYLNTKNLKFDPNYIDKLNQRINGHPMILLMIASLSNNKDLTEIIDNIPKSEIDKYLYDEIYRRLTEEEQELLKSASIFRAPFVAETCVYVSGMENVKKLLIELENKFLIKKKDELYYLHDIIREFSYDQIDDSKKYHKMAAEFYSKLEKNSFNIEETIYHLTKYKGGLDEEAINYLLELPDNIYNDTSIIGFLDTYPIKTPVVYDLFQKLLNNSTREIKHICVIIMVRNTSKNNTIFNFDRTIGILKDLIDQKGTSEFLLTNISNQFTPLLNIDLEKCLPLIDDIMNKASDHTIQNLCFALRDHRQANELILERLNHISSDISCKYSITTKQLASSIAKEIKTTRHDSILSSISDKLTSSSIENTIINNVNYSNTVDLLVVSILFEKLIKENKDNYHSLIQNSMNKFIKVTILPSYVISNSLISPEGLNIEFSKKLILSNNYSAQATIFLASLQSYTIIYYLGKKFNLTDESFISFYELVKTQCNEILALSIKNGVYENNTMEILHTTFLNEIKSSNLQKSKLTNKLLNKFSEKISSAINPNLFKHYAEATSFEGQYKEYYKLDFIAMMALVKANPHHIIDALNTQGKKLNIEKIVVPTYYDMIQKYPEKIIEIIDSASQNTNTFIGKYTLITWAYLPLIVTPKKAIDFFYRLAEDESYQNVELKTEMIYLVNLLIKWLNILDQNSKQNSPELSETRNLAEEFIQSFKNDDSIEVRQFLNFITRHDLIQK